MTESILVPLDGTPLAETVLPAAQRWAQATGRHLILLTVLPSPRVGDPLTGEVNDAPTVPYPIWQARQAETQGYLEEVVARLAASGTRAIASLRVGDPATEIVVAAASEPGMTGVAMSTHGRSGLGRLVWGSVVETVLLSSPQPLLVLHPPAVALTAPAAPQPYATLLVPLDGSPEAEAALALARPLAQPGATRIVLLLAAPESTTELSWAVRGPGTGTGTPADYLARQAAPLGAAGLRVQTQVVTGRPAAAIAAYGATCAADLIVMTTHCPQGLDRVLTGSVAWEVVQQAGRPVLLHRADSRIAGAARHVTGLPLAEPGA